MAHLDYEVIFRGKKVNFRLERFNDTPQEAYKQLVGQSAFSELGQMEGSDDGVVVFDLTSLSPRREWINISAWKGPETARSEIQQKEKFGDPGTLLSRFVVSTIVSLLFTPNLFDEFLKP